MKNVIIGLLILTAFFAACDKTTPTPTTKDWNHDLWDGLLAQYVNAAGDVNYAGLKNEQSTVEEYLNLLSDHAPSSTWSANKEMAYWVNLYNAFTIYNILKEYPVASIMDIDNGMIWDQRKVRVGDTEYTLNQIEQERLLAKFSEPRVHFAVNCAAASCPPLLNKAWTEDNIQQYYTDQARTFINDTNYNLIQTNNIEVSEIFNWYAADFGGSSQIVSYIQQYADSTIANNATVQYKTYDWSLNEQ